jgi:hypothetical protein
VKKPKHEVRYACLAGGARLYEEGEEVQFSLRVEFFMLITARNKTILNFGNSVVYYGGSLIPTITNKMKENLKIMASKTSGSRKLKKNTLPKFEAEVYSKIPSGGLIVFAVHYLIEQKIEITLEDIVSLCFLLFPHKFGLKRYPKWPDSAPISRHWGDVRRKRYVTANDYLGYRLTTKGTRLVKRVAKVLGVKLPKPIVKVQSVREEKETVLAPIKKIRPVRVKKVSLASVKQTQAVTPETQAKKASPVQEEKVTPPVPVKKVRPVRVKKISPAPLKQVQKPEIKVLPVREEKATPPAPVKKIRPVRVKKISPVPEKKTQVVKAPTQVKETKPAKPIIIQPVKAEKVRAEPVSREAKERAGKFTRMMERSDAYIHYKKNGSKSYISEFDFRSLLLCTMESSAETLTRNVNLFKGYAEIHHRQDLIVFLTFCEDKFSYLLKPARKLKK